MPDLTPRIGIKKPLGNENVSRASFNENWDIIDAKVATLGSDGKVPEGQLPIQNAFANINVNGALVTADYKADQFNVYPGTGISVSANSPANSMTISLDETPWTDLTLTGGAIVYATGSDPEFKKVGDQVYIQGAVKGLTGVGTTVATLPVGFRPTQSVSFCIPISNNNGAQFARWTISSAGAIVMESITAGASTSTTTWYSMTMSFSL
jgi:hypothetical protein